MFTTKRRRGCPASKLVVAASVVLRRRVNYFSLCGMWIDNVFTGGCANIPFPFLKINTCSSRFVSLATSI